MTNGANLPSQSLSAGWKGPGWPKKLKNLPWPHKLRPLQISIASHKRRDYHEDRLLSIFVLPLPAKPFSYYAVQRKLRSN
jgi:hypothetical protein